MTRLNNVGGMILTALIWPLALHDALRGLWLLPFSGLVIGEAAPAVSGQTMMVDDRNCTSTRARPKRRERSRLLCSANVFVPRERSDFAEGANKGRPAQSSRDLVTAFHFY